MTSPQSWPDCTRQELEWFAANGTYEQRQAANAQLESLRTYQTGDLFNAQQMPFSLERGQR